MHTIDTIIVGYTVFFAIFFIFFLLYQFDIVSIKDKTIFRWLRVANILETILLIIVHIFSFSIYGTYGLAAFYILNAILLLLQFIFADWGIGRKILDIFWLCFYALLFAIDIFKISLVDIVSYISNSENLKVLNYIFEDTFIGKLIIGIITPVLRTVILEAIHRNE